MFYLKKTPTKYREFSPTLFFKTIDFQLVFNFEQTRTIIIFGEHNGSYTMMAEPIRALELHYPMIQFLIIDLIHDTRHLCTCFTIVGIKAMSHGISGDR